MFVIGYIGYWGVRCSEMGGVVCEYNVIVWGDWEKSMLGYLEFVF